MSRFTNLQKGLKIIREVEGDVVDYSAEHDVIYIGTPSAKYKPQDIRELEDLGFHVDEGLDSFYHHT